MVRTFMPILALIMSPSLLLAAPAPGTGEYQTLPASADCQDYAESPAWEHVVTTGVDFNRSLTVEGTLAYLACDGDGMRIVDLAAGPEPVVIGSVGLFGYEPVHVVSVQGDYAYLGTEDVGLYAADVSDPTAPIIVGAAAVVGGQVVGIEAVGSHLYFVGQGAATFGVADISDPTSPDVIADVALPSVGNDIAVSGNYAYVAGDYTFLVIEIDQPDNPGLSVVFGLPDRAISVEVVGETAYVAVNTAGLYIYDISNPLPPTELSHWTAGVGNVRDVTVESGFAYLAFKEEGLVVLDVSDPTSPSYVGTLAGMSTATRRIDRSADRVCMVDRYNGLQIAPLMCGETDAVQQDLPSGATRLFTAFPNPFNPQTTIEFDTPEDGRAALRIYDVRGALVRVLVDDALPRGGHQATWDGRDTTGRAVASGSYFARLEAQGRVETVRMSLVR